MIAARMDFFAAQPRNDLLSDRQANEAYLRCVPGRQYAVYSGRVGGKAMSNRSLSFS